MEQGKKRGRPSLNGLPMTGTERKQRHREKLAKSGVKTITAELFDEVIGILDWYRGITAESRSEALNQIVLMWNQDNAEKLFELEKDLKERHEERLKNLAEQRGKRMNSNLKEGKTK